MRAHKEAFSSDGAVALEFKVVAGLDQESGRPCGSVPLVVTVVAEISIWVTRTAPEAECVIATLEIELGCKDLKLLKRCGCAPVLVAIPTRSVGEAAAASVHVAVAGDGPPRRHQGRQLLGMRRRRERVRARAHAAAQFLASRTKLTHATVISDAAIVVVWFLARLLRTPE